MVLRQRKIQIDRVSGIGTNGYSLGLEGNLDFYVLFGNSNVNGIEL